ncbi:transglycosylase SLT domain-containing protein [Pseudonocardia sp. MH-G8]|uniref:transglycosylase SLT domain-containing protein n=1 Tax=Pseudonocardia sp. MH-G8 TaxID=1854588 RepID=UPI000B9FAB43|nr:transglycosylase SLT domain-containing protein [Pseudonocardia sp. MH-G8]
MTSPGRLGIVGGGLVALMLAPVLIVGLLIGGVAVTQPSETKVDASALPAGAARLIPELERVLGARCPELPLPFAVAHINAESSWNPHAYNPEGRAAGLYQFQEPTWTSAGGTSWGTAPPPAEADVFDPVRHLEIAVPWLCANLRTVRAHLADSGKPVDPLDALLVCHIAGCSRVTGSASGIPTAGEAGCDSSCAQTITSYINRVRTQAEQLVATPVPAALDGLPAPAPFTGTSNGCTAPDPSSTGCLTPATHHALEQLLHAFGAPGAGAPIRSFTCWDTHAWNPSSDHPRGRACDFFPSRAGVFPEGAELANGWRIAGWLRAHAAALQVRYIIWQGRIWSPDSPDIDGWGRPYTGGGIYDINDATGGHYDHVHLSVRG